MTEHDADRPDTTTDDRAADDGGDDRAADAASADTTEERAAADAEQEVPPDVVDEVERLTRLARDAVDENEAAAYRAERDDLVSTHDFEARVREDEARDTLVLYPAEWIDEDGLIRRERIEDVDRGIERPLEGPGAGDDWEEIEAYNSEVVERVADEHGEHHAANARAFADFMGNHRASPLDDATDDDVAEFLDEYYPRNVWPTDEQREVVAESVELALETAESTGPVR
jgi:hypothetical protein